MIPEVSGPGGVLHLIVDRVSDTDGLVVDGLAWIKSVRTRIWARLMCVRACVRAVWWKGGEGGGEGEVALRGGLM